jgi:hypothetical protein
MTLDGKPWVGDQIHDEDLDRDGIITDVRAGTYVLRPLWGRGEWTNQDHERLTLIVALQDRTN